MTAAIKMWQLQNTGTHRVISNTFTLVTEKHGSVHKLSCNLKSDRLTGLRNRAITELQYFLVKIETSVAHTLARITFSVHNT